MDLNIEAGGAGRPLDLTAFYFDVASAECWLAAERVIQTLGSPAPWIPVMSDQLTGPKLDQDLTAIAALADARGLLPLKASAEPQIDSREMMLAATYARQGGKIVAFALAAMRQCWCAGRNVADRDTIMLAGAAAEVHPNAISKALGMRSLAAELERATADAQARGITAVPAVRVGERVFIGDSQLESAALEVAK